MKNNKSELERLVNDAVNMCRENGVIFDDKSPSFSPKNDINKKSFSVTLRPDSKTKSHYIDFSMHIDNLSDVNSEILARTLINIYNDYSEGKAKEIK